jgi:hypothetical protein
MEVPSKIKKYFGYTALIVFVCWLVISVYIRKDISEDVDKNFISQGISASSICYSVDFNGRLGNLMFEYALLVGICSKKNTSRYSCAVVQNPNINPLTLPVQKFVRGFSIPNSQIGCKLNSSNLYIEHEDKASYFFKSKAFQQPSGLIFVMIDFVIQYYYYKGVTFTGYYQSWKYFHHAQLEIRQSFKFSSQAEKASIAFIQSIHENMKSSVPVTIVGVHVRLGDKISKNITVKSYNPWSLSLQYYEKAIKLVQDRRKMSHTSLAFVFFTGGAMKRDKVAKDNNWTKKNLGTLITNSILNGFSKLLYS